MKIDVIIKSIRYTELLYCKKTRLWFLNSKDKFPILITFKSLKALCDIEHKIEDFK